MFNRLGLLRGKLLAHDHQSRCGAALNHLQSVPKASLVSCFAEANGRQKAETVGCPRRKGQDSANRGFDDTASAVALLERLPFLCIGWLVGWMDGWIYLMMGLSQRPEVCMDVWISVVFVAFLRLRTYHCACLPHARQRASKSLSVSDAKPGRCGH